MKSFNKNNGIKGSLKGFYNALFQENKTLNKENVEILNKIQKDIEDENYDNFKAYNKILEYELFNEEFYLNECDFKPEIDPLLHYIYIGHTKNLNPCEIFDTSYYRNFNENITTENPLVYLVNRGIDEGIISVNEDMWQPLSINKFDFTEDEIRKIMERNYWLEMENEALKKSEALTQVQQKKEQ